MDAEPALRLASEWNGSIGSADGGMVAHRRMLQVVFAELDAAACTDQEGAPQALDRNYRVSDGDTAQEDTGVAVLDW